MPSDNVEPQQSVLVSGLLYPEPSDQVEIVFKQVEENCQEIQDTSEMNGLGSDFNQMTAAFRQESASRLRANASEGVFVILVNI